MTQEVNVYTIGFTKTNAEGFFERLRKAGVKTVIDVRLHNTSQLAAFAKADDLAYFLKKIGNMNYLHQPLLAPTDSMLKAFKKEKGDWGAYENRFRALMADRQIEKRITAQTLDGACLLCSEATPHHCHRRLVCEYLNERWDGALRVNHI
ncbi:MAG: hypothetical protein QOF07_156 [Bradyrhizobium sp.]|jgi:uncharacterized protein (DUF488 family)|nr:hypothetical protein [Bradyrhizobium sp.]